MPICMSTHAHPKKVLHVKYEDLVRDPENELKRIGEFIEVEITPLTENVLSHQMLPMGHQIGGNEFRHEEYFIFKYGERSRNRTWIQNFLAWVLCWPFLLRYGYR